MSAVLNKRAAERAGERGDRMRDAAKLARELVSHKAIYRYLRVVLPAGYLVYHIPNEGHRSAAEAAKLKAMGLLPGAPDLEIVQPGGNVFYIEVKRMIGGTLSDDQKAFKSHCFEHGIPWALCRSIEDARQALIGWGIETREVIA